MQIYNIFKRLRFLQNIYSKFHIYRDFFFLGGGFIVRNFGDLYRHRSNLINQITWNEFFV